MDVDDARASDKDYTPSPPETPQPVVKKKKGKQRKVEKTPEDNSDVPLSNLVAASTKEKKYWRPPRATGENHEAPCEHCEKKEIPCQKEVGGGACVECCRGKVKCIHSTVKNTRPRKRRRVVVKVPVERMAVEKRRPKKSMPYVEVTDDENEDKTTGRPAPASLQAPALNVAAQAAVNFEHGQ
jgi:hypothetical protein